MTSKQLPELLDILWHIQDSHDADIQLYGYLTEMHQFVKELDERVKQLEERTALPGLL